VFTAKRYDLMQALTSNRGGHRSVRRLRGAFVIVVRDSEPARLRTGFFLVDLGPTARHSFQLNRDSRGSV